MAAERDTARRVQTATWGMLIIWAGILMATNLNREPPGLGLTVLGAIFLLSGIVQRSVARREGYGFLIAGTVILLVGVNELVAEGRFNVGAIAVIVIGVVILGTAVRPRHRKGRPAVGEGEDR